MKKISPFFLALILFYSCKKSTTGTGATYKITVKEYKTGIPLDGVRISLYKCSNFIAGLGCRSTILYAAHFTDNNGECEISEKDITAADEGIILTRPQYFDVSGGTGVNQMEPEAHATITIKTSKSYPDTSMMDITAASELGNGSAQTFKAPLDSTINFRLFGNETNEIHWVVYTVVPNCQFYCPRDTLSFGSITLNPQKFETVTASIDY